MLCGTRAISTRSLGICDGVPSTARSSSLLRKLYLESVMATTGYCLRIFIRTAPQGSWAGELSDPINTKQVARQGGVLSTWRYKRYNNPILLQLENMYSRMKIGSISMPHITVADDLAILAQNQSDVQVMLWDVRTVQIRERYCVHPTKIHIIGKDKIWKWIFTFWEIKLM